MDSPKPKRQKKTFENASLVPLLSEQTLKNSSDLISIVDESYVYRIVNDEYLRRYKITEEQIVGHHASEILGKKAFEESVKPNFDRCLAGERVRYQDWFGYPELGSRYMDVFYHPVRSDSDSVEYVTVTVRDITDLKKNEQSLAASESRFRSLIELMSDFVYELDKELNYIFVGPREKSVGARTPEDFQGKTPFDFMPPEEAEKLFEFAKMMIKSPQPIRNIESTVIHKDGRHIVVETSAVPTYDADGDFTGYLCIDRDITERKQAEVRLREREAHLNSILETSLDGIAVTSEDQRIVHGNSALASMYGYDKVSDLIGTGTDTYFAPESYPVLSSIRERLDRGGKINEAVEFKGLRKDGTTFDAELRIGSFYEEGRRLDVGVVRDITEKKKMQFQLNQSGKLAAVGELAAGVAHEINNPIAAIAIYIGLLRDTIEDAGRKIDKTSLNQLEQYLEIIEEQVERCHSVTDNLLSFTRIPSSKDEDVNINELLQQTIELVNKLTDRNPKIEVTLDDGLPVYRCDPSMLQQVFVNLLNNALRAIEPEGTIRIATVLESNGDVRIEFRDDGHGISEEIRDRIFDPFFTTWHEREGIGLGLSISHYIIKQMNGEIRLESVAGDGSVFVVILPGKNAAEEHTGPSSTR